MSERKSVKVRAPDGTIKDCAIKLYGTSTCKLEFFGLDLETMKFSGDDFFEVLIQVRLELEKKGYQLLCAGARPDVFPSGLSRSMGGARKAYITRIGAPSRKADLVDIFDYAAPEKVGSVAQQKAFHERWEQTLSEEMNRDCYGKATSVRKAVRVLASDGKIRDCEVEISGIPPSKIAFSGMDVETREFSGEDLFDAFIQLRLELEKYGFLLLCAGCRPEVVSLGFTRTINGGFKSCVLRTDIPSAGADFIDIFDYAPPEEVGSVAEQQACERKWANISPRRPKGDR